MLNFDFYSYISFIQEDPFTKPATCVVKAVTRRVYCHSNLHKYISSLTIRTVLSNCDVTELAQTRRNYCARRRNCRDVSFGHLKVTCSFLRSVVELWCSVVRQRCRRFRISEIKNPRTSRDLFLSVSICKVINLAQQTHK